MEWEGYEYVCVHVYAHTHMCKNVYSSCMCRYTRVEAHIYSCKCVHVKARRTTSDNIPQLLFTSLRVCICGGGDWGRCVCAQVPVTQVQSVIWNLLANEPQIVFSVHLPSIRIRNLQPHISLYKMMTLLFFEILIQYSLIIFILIPPVILDAPSHLYLSNFMYSLSLSTHTHTHTHTHIPQSGPSSLVCVVLLVGMERVLECGVSQVILYWTKLTCALPAAIKYQSSSPRGLTLSPCFLLQAAILYSLSLGRLVSFILSLFLWLHMCIHHVVSRRHCFHGAIHHLWLSYTFQHRSMSLEVEAGYVVGTHL
jgi:hypothetical protein